MLIKGKFFDTQKLSSNKYIECTLIKLLIESNSTRAINLIQKKKNIFQYRDKMYTLYYIQANPSYIPNVRTFTMKNFHIFIESSFLYTELYTSDTSEIIVYLLL